jgi:uncharacterized membrane protein YhaH (DUF805 family)
MKSIPPNKPQDDTLLLNRTACKETDTPQAGSLWSRLQGARTRLFSFRGRLARSRYWATLILLGVILAIIGDLNYLMLLMAVDWLIGNALNGIGGSSSHSSFPAIIEILYLVYLALLVFGFVLTIWILLAAAVRRLRDVGLSNRVSVWLSLLVLLPGLNVIALLCFGLPGSHAASTAGPSLVASATVETFGGRKQNPSCAIP